MMKRLLNKKGSVLFLVVVVMSILIVAASATFYIVNNQQSSVNVRYSSEQSYQTAVSVSDTVSKYIDGYVEAITSSKKSFSTWKDSLVANMLKMGTGSTENITSQLDLSDMNMGKVDVKIKKLGTKPDTVNAENTVHSYEIQTTSNYNGEEITIKQIKEIITGPVEYFTRFLTCTGYNEEDVTFGAYLVLSESYFENEYTVVGASSATCINNSLYSSGTLYVRGLQYSKPKEEIEIVIKDNLIMERNSMQFLKYGGKAYIGNDFISEGTFLWGDEMYVLGDFISEGGQLKSGCKLYVAGDCHLGSIANNMYFANEGDMYINGDLYIDVREGYTLKGSYYVNGNIYINIDNNGGIQTETTPAENHLIYGGELNFTKGGWVSYQTAPVSSGGTPSIFTDQLVANTKAYIIQNTASYDYEIWDVEDKYFNKQGITREITLDDVSDSAVRKLGKPENLPWRNDYLVTIDESCTIHPATEWESGKHYIIVDTTVNDKDIYIKLDSGAASAFSFTGFKADGKTPKSTFNLIVKGKHSVIFILPQDKDFVMDNASFIGHKGFAEAITGKTLDEIIGDYNDNIDNRINIRDEFYDYKRGGFNPDTGELTQGAVKAVDTWFKDDKVPNQIDRSKFTDPTVHNNIFLVTKGVNKNLDFSSQSTFCGYVYAPKSMIRSDTTNGPCLTFIGGMIVGSYTYSNLSAALMFTTPCDVDNNYPISKPSDIVKHLIKFANSNGGISGEDISTLEVKGYNPVGYE